MLTGDGAPKILDFGLVKGGSVPADLSHSATELQVSQAGMVFGTASYMSPEQARGEPVDFRSDQFAFGLVLYEMATGRHPFRRGTAVETLASILDDDPEPLGDSLPEPFVWVVERCLAKRPSERYGSTADLARDLARLRDRTSSGVRPVSTPTRVAWTWWSGAVAAALLIALLVTIAMWRRSPAVSGDALQVSVSMPAIANVFLGEVAQPVAISPDGKVPGYLWRRCTWHESSVASRPPFRHDKADRGECFRRGLVDRQQGDRVLRRRQAEDGLGGRRAAAHCVRRAPGEHALMARRHHPVRAILESPRYLSCFRPRGSGRTDRRTREGKPGFRVVAAVSAGRTAVSVPRTPSTASGGGSGDHARAVCGIPGRLGPSVDRHDRLARCVRRRSPSVCP